MNMNSLRAVEMRQPQRLNASWNNSTLSHVLNVGIEMRLPCLYLISFDRNST